jgi:nicotinate-nucleotide pyrophosphorylase
MILPYPSILRIDYKAMEGQDIRDLIFSRVEKEKYLAHLSAQGEGVLSGTGWLKKACENLGIRLRTCKKDGTIIRPSEIIAILEGYAKQMASGEEELIGWISKASGIATAAWMAKKAAGRNLKIVSGAWKKMPFPLKDLVRQAIVDGGIQYRIVEKPFVYLDKNYVRMLGGVSKALRSIRTPEGIYPGDPVEGGRTRPSSGDRPCGTGGSRYHHDRYGQEGGHRTCGFDAEGKGTERSPSNRFRGKHQDR